MSNTGKQRHADSGSADEQRYTQQVNSVAYVGGGDNGLLSALALDASIPDVDVTIIDDFDEDQPTVGKSMLPAFSEVFHKFLNVDRMRLISEVPVGFKLSVYYKDWCGDNFHNPAGESLPVVTSNQFDIGRLPPRAEFDEFYHRYHEGEFSEIYGEVAENTGIAPFWVDYSNGLDVNLALKDASYHFNTGYFNEFLRTLCEEREIALIDDRIDEIETDGSRIEQLHGERQSYDADLYVDATGFSRTLRSELDHSFVDFDIPVDSAVKGEVEIPLSDVESATVVTTGTAGWFWQIDTYHQRDIGYVYSSDHISDEEATQELLETRDEDLDPDGLERLRWDAKLLEQPWVTNCIAVGNAYGFTEPLQAFSETASMILSYWLGTLLSKHGQFNNAGIRDLYNDISLTMWEEIYDFQSLFYRYNSGSTPFWEHARSIDAGRIEQCDAYQSSGIAPAEELRQLTRTDLDQNRYYLYFLVLQGLGVESEFYEEIEYDVEPAVVQLIEEYNDEIEDRVGRLLTYQELYHLLDLDLVDHTSDRINSSGTC